MNSIKVKKDIDRAIADTFIEIIKEPLTYFSEADVQQLLTEELRTISELAKKYLTSVPKGGNAKSKYSTSLLHREYGAGDGKRFDIVILDEKNVAKITDINLTIDNEYLQPAFVFELGTEKTSDTATHFQNDIDKLKNCKDTGYLIHIYKDVTQSATGTLSREKTEAKIKRSFQDVFTSNSVSIPQEVKILGILIRTYRKQKKMWGKCEIFDRASLSWKKVNINEESKLREAILSQLT